MVLVAKSAIKLSDFHYTFQMNSFSPWYFVTLS
jgi:hypothetical protein